MKFGTEMKVGIFTIVGISVLIYMFIVLSPRAFTNSATNSYYTVVTDAAGIVPKTHVRTNGVSVGKVEDVVLEASRSKLLFSIDRSVKIPTGSKIEVRTRGFLGETFLEVIRGPDTGEYIADGGLIPLSEDTVGMTQLVSVLGAIAKDVKMVTTSLASALGNKDGEQKMIHIVDNIENATNSMREILENNKFKVGNLLSNLEKTTDSLRQAIGDRPEDIKTVVANIKETTTKLLAFSDNLNQIVDGENRDRIQRIIAQFDKTMDDVKATASSVRLASAKIENGEGTLGRLINDDSVLVDLQNAIKDVRQVLAPANKLQVTVSYRGELYDKTSQNYFNLYFRTRPDKFYLLGATDTANSVRNETTTSEQTVTNGVTTTRTTENYNEKRSLRFNLQFGKRWSNLVVRFGLFESSGGIAADYFLWSDRLKLTAEIFEFDKASTVRRTAHGKAYASFLIFNHVYAIGGINDPSKYGADGKVQKKISPFFAAGLEFNDDDIKAIAGSAALAR
jgi:phospholipid/cholesterol/gamma-HCH transport system substrate-binding protein